MEAHTCHRCGECVEAPLQAVRPEVAVCLDCMTPHELELLEQDLNQVQAVDRGLWSGMPAHSDWDFEVHYVPSRVLSGDFYDISPVAMPGMLSVVIGDVSGKGIPAALLRAGLLGCLRAFGAELKSPALILEKSNAQFLATTAPNGFASTFLGTLCLTTGELVYANAGHLPPLVRRRDGIWECLAPTGVALGVLRGATYVERALLLEPGDLLLAYSDGITEVGAAPSPGGERLQAVVDGLGRVSAAEIAAGVVDELRRVGPATPDDDQTLLVLQRH